MPPEPEIAFTDRDLVDNPVMQCPCLLVLDTSSSMAGEPIRELNAGVQAFLQDIRGDVRAKEAVELGVITFDSEVREVLSFGPVEHAQLPVLQASGFTRMGQAVRLAIRSLRERRERYKNAGVSSYVPWLVLMTDGGPTDDWPGAAAELKSLGEQQKIVVFAVGIGSGCDFETLKKFCPANRPPFRLAGYDFKRFFNFMSRSLEAVVTTENADGGFAIPAAPDDRPAGG